MEKHGINESIQTIEASIMNGWQGLFFSKDHSKIKSNDKTDYNVNKVAF